MNRNKSHRMIVKLCAAAMMTAIVFVGNYLRVKIPVPLGGVTSFTLANILCALSGILLGPVWGGLSAGLGSAIFDLMDPAYVAEAPITFCTKGMYGLVAGLVLYLFFRHAREKYLPQLAATTAAAVSYMVVYLVKNYFYNGMFIQGFTQPEQCWALVISKLPATIFNGGIAIVVAPILGTALIRAMKKARLDSLLAQ